MRISPLQPPQWLRWGHLVLSSSSSSSSFFFIIIAHMIGQAPRGLGILVTCLGDEEAEPGEEARRWLNWDSALQPRQCWGQPCRVPHPGAGGRPRQPKISELRPDRLLPDHSPWLMPATPHTHQGPDPSSRHQNLCFLEAEGVWMVTCQHSPQGFCCSCSAHPNQGWKPQLCQCTLGPPGIWGPASAGCSAWPQRGLTSLLASLPPRLGMPLSPAKSPGTQRPSTSFPSLLPCDDRPPCPNSHEAPLRALLLDQTLTPPRYSRESH